MELDPDMNLDVAYLDNIDATDSQGCKGGELLAAVRDFFVSFSKTDGCYTAEDDFPSTINGSNLSEISKEESNVTHLECDAISNSESVESMSICSVINESNISSAPKYDLRKRKHKLQNSSQLFSKSFNLREKLFNLNKLTHVALPFYPGVPQPNYTHILQNDYGFFVRSNHHMSSSKQSTGESAKLIGTSESRTNQIHYEMRQWICDCTVPTVEEISVEIVACGPGCINRALNIECGPHCRARDFCSNRQFQYMLYAPTEPVYAGPLKGWGLKALDLIKKDSFIIEYVGEVIDFCEFRRRIRRYERIGHAHHYFMALESDRFLDAGSKGNWARFVNHSCEPNCVTQKWSVDGQIRIGFFAKQDIPPNEEITIDYQFVQYGLTEQKCYCATKSCSGVMGATNKYLQDKVRLKDTTIVERRILQLLQMDSFKEAEDITLLLQVMVQECLTRYTRFQLLERLIATKNDACLKLFRQYNGLDMLAAFMCDASAKDWELKRQILICLNHIPVSEQTQVQSNSKLMDIVYQWTMNPEHCRSRSFNRNDVFHDQSNNSRDFVGTIVRQSEQDADQMQERKCEQNLSSDDNRHNSESGDTPMNELNADTIESNTTSLPKVEDCEKSDGIWIEEIKQLAMDLYEKWLKLPKENYRIPLLERQETEKMLHMPYTDSTVVSWGAQNEENEELTRHSWTGDQLGNLKPFRSRHDWRDNNVLVVMDTDNSLSKAERRSLFEAKVLEEERKFSSNKNNFSNNSKRHDDDATEPTSKSDLSSDPLGQLLVIALLNKCTQLDPAAMKTILNDPSIMTTLLKSVPSSTKNITNPDNSEIIDQLGKVLKNYIQDASNSLPSGWQPAYDSTGRTYYYNVETRAVQWNKPENSESNKQLDEKKKQFTRQVGRYVMNILKPFRLSNCLTGRIDSNDDFIHISRKFTHAFVSKALKNSASNDFSFTKEFQDRIRLHVTRYMTSRGTVYKRRSKQ